MLGVHKTDDPTTATPTGMAAPGRAERALPAHGCYAGVHVLVFPKAATQMPLVGSVAWTAMLCYPLGHAMIRIPITISTMPI